MEMTTTVAILLMTLQSIVRISPLHASGENRPGDATLKYQGYGVGNVWAGLIWNRFPAEFYPLFLSPLLEKGKIKEAQKRSRVWNLGSGDIESYSGYFTVNRQYNSNMFFWFFPAERKKAEAPVLLWLNGGPGRTSLVGTLLENGPWEVNENGTELTRREVSWTQNFSMLYVDNPVGVGYSFLKDKAGLSKSMKDVAENLYSVVVQFFQMFPEYSQLPFYVGGQSYAGKYVPALGRYLHDRNTDPLTPPHHLVNFKGIYVGGGFCDPEHMMPVFPDYLYHSGMIAEKYRQEMKEQFINIIKDWQQGNVSQNTMFFLSKFFSIPSQTIGIDSLDHLLGAEATNDHLMEGLNTFMNSPVTRLKLHVGYASQTNSGYMLWSRDAAVSLMGDILLNTSRENALLMDNYKVLHYSGNLDIVVNVPMTEAFLQHVQWRGQAEYRLQCRQKWHVQGKLAGWVNTVHNFTRVVIRNCGHMAPYDQPEWTLSMMNSFIFDLPFEKQP